jgi:hypothetical protein
VLSRSQSASAGRRPILRVSRTTVRVLTAPDEDRRLAAAEAYGAATATNDASLLRAVHEPDALTWHNVDGLSVSVDDSVRALAWLHARVPDLQLEDVSTTPTASGFVVRWTMTGTAPGGPLLLRSCVVVELSPAGKVSRAAEYLDSAALAVLRSRWRSDEVAE